MRARMDAVRARELESALRKLGELGPNEREVVAELSRTLMNKFLHDPTVRLRAAAANGRGLGVVDTARYLFGLERAGGAGSTPAANEDTSNNE
jgi:glutamyl-tRNA reductase